MDIKTRIKLLNGMDVWHTQAIDECLPSILLTDGPHGVRKQYNDSDNLGINNSIPATLFPSLTNLSCTFNEELAYFMGDALGKECKSLGVNVLLGPGINIKRNALCGRNFEYLSEDPYLSGTLAAKYIEGLQSNNVAASLKHFACNNQETYRYNINTIVDERALKEIYLKNFQLALAAKPKTVMCSYNKLNNILVSENKYLLDDILRKEFKYPGVIISDWGAVSNPVESLKATLDLQMPATYGYTYKKIKQAYKKGKLDKETIINSSNRIIKLINELKDKKIENFDRDYVEEIARKVATESIVLLKNEDNILPFNTNEKILVVGEFASNPRCQGGGSSFVNCYHKYTLLTEIDKFTRNYKYLQGYSLDNPYLDDKLTYDVINEAQNYDKVLIMTGLPDTYEIEGIDRKDFNIPSSHLKLIEEVRKINKNIVVCLYTGSAVKMPFIDQVKGIVNCHLLGFDSGTPLLNVLFGRVSPSGRLPYTNPKEIFDDITSKNFANSNNAVYYLESIYVGYRYFETFNKEILFPFGYGLSYANITYSNLEVDKDVINKDELITVKVKVKNNSNIKASEVVMLFIQNNKSSVYKPLRELRKYTKVSLNPYEEKEVTFSLDYFDFSYYDINLKRFHVDKGIYKVQICKNAKEVLLEKEIQRLENDKDFVKHPFSNYFNVDNVTIEDFQKLFTFKLPPLNLKKKRPFSLDNNLEDIKDTFLGKIICKMIFKETKKLYKEKDKNWVINYINNTIMQTPLRTIAMMSNQKISLFKMQAIVDFINFRIFKGFINLIRG